MKRLLLCGVLSLLVLSLAAQERVRERIHLKSGEVVEGTVVEQVPGRYVVLRQGDGTEREYPLDEVSRIVRLPRVGRAEGPRYDIPSRMRMFALEFAWGFTRHDYSSGFHFVGGYYFTPAVSLGAGTGFVSADAYERREVVEDGVVRREELVSAMFVPLFARLQVDLLQHRATPFFRMDAGALVAMQKSGNTLPILHPAVGLSMRFRKRMSLDFALGYRFQNESCLDYGDGYDNSTRGAVSFQVGFHF